LVCCCFIEKPIAVLALLKELGGSRKMNTIDSVVCCCFIEIKKVLSAIRSTFAMLEGVNSNYHLYYSTQYSIESLNVGSRDL